MPLLDFAEAYKETADEPLVVRIDALDLRVPWPRRVGRWLTGKPTTGLIVRLPGSMPAGLRLHMWSVKQQASDESRELTYGELIAAGRYLLGERAFQRLLDARIEQQHLSETVMGVLAMYSAREAIADVEARAPAGGSAAPRTSSATSGPSKPTSNGSTGSTSPVVSVLSG